jgi:hypothetical protein
MQRMTELAFGHSASLTISLRLFLVQRLADSDGLFIKAVESYRAPAKKPAMDRHSGCRDHQTVIHYRRLLVLADPVLVRVERFFL